MLFESKKSTNYFVQFFSFLGIFKKILKKLNVNFKLFNKFNFIFLKGNDFR